MKKVRIVISMIACAFVGVGLFAGGNGEEAREPSEENTVTMVAPNWYDPDIFTRAIDRFETLYPDIEVGYVSIPAGGWGDYFTKIRLMMASGERIDVFNMPIEGVLDFQSAGLLLPMRDYIDRYPEAVDGYSDLHPRLQSVFERDGEVYGFVWDWNNVVTYINTDMLQSAGLPFPDGEWTRDEFLRYARAMTGEFDGRQVYGALVPTYYFGYSAWLYAFGASILTDDMTAAAVSSPEAVACFQFMHDLIHEYGVAPLPEGNWSVDMVNAMAAEQVAMIFAGRWPEPTLKSNGINFDIQYIPLFHPERTVVFGSGGWPVYADSSAADAAFLLSAFMGSAWSHRELLSEFNIPARISVMEDLFADIVVPANAAIYRESADFAKGVESPIGYAEIQEVMNAAVNAILLNAGANVREILAGAETEINQILARN